ncbi:glutamate--cysteine ligase [Snodgrassella sp. B3088]|uniref:glutamate--cysteine ligase n=1 Tax=unclassified Snodgrassella TaxID=2625236 RepID=UPI00226A4A6D|nr:MULTISPECIES: glutamate--cysteine ligase [unclassified Snodgrassella]MCX8749019.1 glutamate--cysteine ligase [Snodgrassella sp. B3088]MCX8752483.1 glutamate--cysteine ligase [Snodgrassella sp. B3837]
MSLPDVAAAHRLELQNFERAILAKQTQIESWFRTQWRHHHAPFYGSVDIRNSGYKLASIDMNLFPGGFNNLNPVFLPLASVAAQDAVERACAEAQSVLLIPENHTRNTFYLQNVYALYSILRHVGLNVRIGTINPEITQITTLETALGDHITLEPVLRQGNRLQLADGFTPCMILLNNDLSGGVPDILQGLEQKLLPPLKAGWTTRRKSTHFHAYNQVAAEFAKLAGIDEWTINPYYEVCSGLDFASHEGENRLADTVERLLQRIQNKYDELGIQDKPFVIVKADAGTYGMGVMSVHSAEEVRGLNRKKRNKMAKIKEGLEVSEVIVQEGIYTYETLHGATAEPVVYMMDRFVIGGFYRVHEGRGPDENLNAIGMHFVPLHCNIVSPETEITEEDTASKREFQPWEQLGIVQTENVSQASDCESVRLYVYGVLARLSLLAAAIELENMPELAV